jgi:anti-sigma B factor antagonist
MWNPFTRRAKEEGARPEARPDGDPTPVGGRHEAARPSSRIATVEVMGSTAVATFTVTELSGPDGSALLTEFIVELVATDSRHFVLDLQNVQFMDSNCLGCLVKAVGQISARGGRLALVNPNHNLQYLFKLTRLDRVFPICADVMAALNAVERRAGAA